MRKSIVTEFEGISTFSGAPAECHHHLIFGVGMRELADQDGLWIPLTHSEHDLSSVGTIYQIHDNPAAEHLSKLCGQLAWEKHEIASSGCSEAEARARFLKRYGRNYA